MTNNLRRFQGFIVWLLLSGVLFSVALSQPLSISGDGLEYIVQTQSFVLDKSISINTNQSVSKFVGDTKIYAKLR